MAATLTQCQQLVAQLAAVFGQAVLQQSSIAKVIYREYQPAVLASGAVTTLNLTDQNGAALTPSVLDPAAGDLTATLPVARLLADPQFFASTLTMLGRKVADYIDQYLLLTYAGFTTNTPVGTPGTALTDGVLAAAWEGMIAAPASEPRYVALATTAGAFSGGLNVISPLTSVAGGNLAIATMGNNYPPKWRGLIPIPTGLILRTGTAPKTTHNLAFTRTAISLVTCQRPLVNDGTHVQSYTASTDGTLGLTLYLAYNSANDAQVLGFGFRTDMGTVARNPFGVQVNS